MSFLRSLFRRIPSFFPTPPRPICTTPETRVEVERPPVKPIAVPEEPSCFAKGIVMSLENEPGQWTRERRLSVIGACHFVYRHATTNIALHRDYPYGVVGERVLYSSAVNMSPTTASDVDSHHIINALDRWNRQEQARKDAELTQLNAPVVAHFAHLACPDTIPVPKLVVWTKPKKKRSNRPKSISRTKSA